MTRKTPADQYATGWSNYMAIKRKELYERHREDAIVA
jgi:hypothetical protein